MATLFSKPLSKSNKVVSSELVHDPMPEAYDNVEEDKKTSKIPLWDQLRSSTRGSTINATTNETIGPTTTPAALRTSTRPIRSTRSSGPSYDLEAATDDPKVEKFSIDVGLGTPWHK